MALFKKNQKSQSNEGAGLEYYIEIALWGVALVTTIIQFYRGNPIPKKPAKVVTDEANPTKSATV